MRSTITRIGVVALAAAALIAAGCGSSKPAHGTASTTTTGGMSVKAYLAEITRINQHLQDQNSAYFHGSGGAAALLRPIQRAYVVTATRLAALHPPAAAVDKQAKLVAFYRAAARKLANVLDHRPFDANRAHSLAISSSERGGQLYSELFSIPG